MGAGRSTAKQPLTRHGLRDATTNLDQIRTWWARWPWANVGIATGAASGLIVIDVDPRSGGTESLARLQSFMGSLPGTLTVSTGGGGRHLFYAHPGGEIGNTAGRLPGVADPLPGVDLRGDGGYVVAPPSRHASGQPYRWASDPTPEPAPAPAWLRPGPAVVFPAAPSRPALRPAAGGSRYGLAALRQRGRRRPPGRRRRPQQPAQPGCLLARACSRAIVPASGQHVDPRVAERLASSPWAPVETARPARSTSQRVGPSGGAAPHFTLCEPS